MAPPISIIVPNLDSPLVATTLESTLRQRAELTDCEVVVVGRDRPGLVPRDRSIVFVETEQAIGPGEARNRGVDAARGEILLFTDADCTPAADWIQRMCAALHDYPVVGGSVRFSLSGNRWAVGDNIASFHELLGDRPAASNSGPVGTLNLGIHRAAWQQVGTFDQELVTSEDFDWYLRARAEGLDVRFEPKAVVEHADVRQSRSDVEGHATWYGTHFLQFCAKHPGVFATGPTWSSRRALAATVHVKSILAALGIYARHPMLRSAARAFPAVVIFKTAWYRAVLAAWGQR